MSILFDLFLRLFLVKEEPLVDLFEFSLENLNLVSLIFIPHLFLSDFFFKRTDVLVKLIPFIVKLVF